MKNMTRSQKYFSVVGGTVLGAACLGLLGSAPAGAEEPGQDIHAPTAPAHRHDRDGGLEAAGKALGTPAPSTAAEGGSIAVGDAPGAIAVTPDGSRGYVLHPGSVSVIDTASNQVAHTIALPTEREDHGVRAMAMSSDGSRLFVVGENATHVIDTAANSLLPALWGPSKAISVAVAPDGKHIALADGEGAAWLVDTTTNKEAEIRLPEGSPALRSGLAFATDSRLYFTTERGAAVIDLNQPGQPAGEFVTGQGEAKDVALSHNGHLYTLDGNGGITVFAPSTKQILAHIADANATSMAHSPDGNRIYITAFSTTGDPAPPAVGVIDTHSNKVIHPAQDKAESTTRSSADASGHPTKITEGYGKPAAGLIDTRRHQAVQKNPEDAEHGAAIAVSPDGGRAYVTDRDAGTVTILKLTDHADPAHPEDGSEQPTPEKLPEGESAPSMTEEPEPSPAQEPEKGEGHLPPPAQPETGDEQPTPEALHERESAPSMTEEPEKGEGYLPPPVQPETGDEQPASETEAEPHH